MLGWQLARFAKTSKRSFNKAPYVEAVIRLGLFKPMDDGTNFDDDSNPKSIEWLLQQIWLSNG